MTVGEETEQISQVWDCECPGWGGAVCFCTPYENKKNQKCKTIVCWIYFLIIESILEMHVYI